MPGSTATGALGRALARYGDAPIGARLFVHGRAFLSDLAVVERYVPKKGFIVDLGCGHGLFACVLRESSPTRRVLGIDLDPRYALTYAQELVTVSLGFTRGGRERFFFPSREEATALFERAGFVVDAVEMPSRPYTDVVYLARKAPTKPS